MAATSDSDDTPEVRSDPIRSLILGGDDDYRAHVFSVIADLGPVAFASLAIVDGGGPGDVVALVAVEQPDVVVLDATGREAGIREVLEALADSETQTGVVVVCEQSTAAARRLGALPKWGWTQDLRGAVQQAYADGRWPGPRQAGPLAGWSEEVPRDAG